ncbi:MAG: FG-GAP-like repeat-containing protein [Hyphomicrobiaceae bacterium]
MPKFASKLAVSSLATGVGFSIIGASAYDYSGVSVASAGDVNGDGFDDLLIGASLVDGPSGTDYGAAYVIFGGPEIVTGPIGLSTLDGTNGFKIAGESASGQLGRAVSSAGDLNGDGIDDFVVASGKIATVTQMEGASYVVFGKTTGFDASIDVADLDGSNGFQISGVSVNDEAGTSVASIGDVNGDGIDDLLIGAKGGRPNLAVGSTGAAYVVYGTTAGFAANVALSGLDGTNGYVLAGELFNEQAGISVSGAGDINGDGLNDFIIGAQNKSSGTGAAYVVFGTDQPVGAQLALSGLDGTNGFQLIGAGSGTHLGWAVGSAGDVNGDGFDDIVVGAPYTGSPANSGSAFVVFGKASGFSADFDVASLDGTNGFRVTGAPASARMGSSVAAAGDINGDGLDDIIVGAWNGGSGNNFPGRAYVIFGQTSGLGATFSVGSLNGNNGFEIDGSASGDRAGLSVSAAGDINSDGFDDLIVGAPAADSNGANAGASYVIYGHATNHAPTAVSLANASFSEIAENTDMSSAILVADILVTDDNDPENNNLFTLTGADAGLFEIVGGQLFLKAGASIDFETNSSLDVAVTVNDPATGGAIDATSETLTIQVLDINELPSNVDFYLDYDSFNENQILADRLLFGTLSIYGEDALGSVTPTLIGTGAGLFELELAGNNFYDLYLKAGVVFDFETQPVIDIAVALDDPTIGGSPDIVSNSVTFEISDVNEAPTGLSFTAVAPAVAEGTVLLNRLKVADVVVADDALGNENLSIAGADAGSFELIGTELYLKAGVQLDFETKSSYEVTVAVYDPAFGVDSAVTGDFTLQITDVSPETAYGGLDDNTITGTDDRDVLIGLDGNDRLEGGQGADLLIGGIGDDTYVFTAGDTIVELVGEGNDTVESAETVSLAANVENLLLTGSDAVNGTGNSLANVMTGNAAANILTGSAGNDTISGEDGNDRLIGGTGRDTMTGGAGKDVFDFNAVGEMGKTASTRDIITDFAHLTDDIDLSTIDASSTAAGNNAFKFIATQAFHKIGGELRFVQINVAGTVDDKTIVEGDTNGDGKADFQIELTGLVTLTAADFVL